MKALATVALMVAVVVPVLVGCGSGDSKGWKEEFTTQVEEVIEASQQVSKVTHSASSGADLELPFAKLNEEL